MAIRILCEFKIDVVAFPIFDYGYFIIYNYSNEDGASQNWSNRICFIKKLSFNIFIENRL